MKNNFSTSNPTGELDSSSTPDWKKLKDANIGEKLKKLDPEWNKLEHPFQLFNKLLTWEDELEEKANRVGPGISPKTLQKNRRYNNDSSPQDIYKTIIWLMKNVGNNTIPEELTDDKLKRVKEEEKRAENKYETTRDAHIKTLGSQGDQAKANRKAVDNAKTDLDKAKAATQRVDPGAALERMGPRATKSSDMSDAKITPEERARRDEKKLGAPPTPQPAELQPEEPLAEPQPEEPPAPPKKIRETGTDPHPTEIGTQTVPERKDTGTDPAGTSATV